MINKYVYYVTLVMVDKDKIETELSGVCLSYEEAEEGIINNNGDAFDCWFRYAVIEKVPAVVGISQFCMPSHITEEGWFEYKRNGNIEQIEKIEKPKEFDGKYGWWVGISFDEKEYNSATKEIDNK